MNTGNLLIGAALVSLLEVDIERGAMVDNAAAIRERCDFAVIAASNFINPRSDLGRLADLVEAIDLPCVVAGLGAQAPRAGAEVTLTEGTTRFVHAVASRSVSIAVRGPNTAQILDDLGIRNVEVLGCPSLAAVPRDTYKAVDVGDPGRFCINGTRTPLEISPSAGKMQALEGALYRQAITVGADYVAQNEVEIALLDGAAEKPRIAAIKRALPGIADMDDARLLAFVRAHCRVFFDTEEWIAYAGGKAISIGTRFHGNVAAISGGTPAMFICHDARTLEMCQFARLPHLSLHEIDDTRLTALAERIDMGPFQRRLPTIRARYGEFFARNGIPHRLPVAAAAQ